MGLKNFKIVFDNPWCTYYPGQTLTGRVIIVLDSPKKIRGINVKLKGEANTCWATDRQEINHEGHYENESQTVSGHEEYFNIQYNLLASSAGGEVELPVGENSYPFSCALPLNLPSSFEHNYGHVRYTAKAIIDRPWKFDHETKMAFTVVSNFDLNKEPRAAEAIHLEMSKTFCCLFCGTPPLNVNVTLPVKGYVPGQVMSARVNIDNHSGIIVETVKIILRKIVTFRANNPRTDTRREKIVVSEVSKGPVDANASVDYEQNLEIPPLPPSNLTNCGIIDLEYNLKVEACVTGWHHRNLKANTLVFIGTVPLKNYQSLILPSPNKMEYINGGEDISDKSADPTYGGYPSGYPAFSPTGGYSPSAPDPPPNYNSDNPAQIQSNSNLYPNLPPPSYEEAGWSVRSLRERGESEYVMGNQEHFAPRYPVYNFKQP